MKYIQKLFSCDKSTTILLQNTENIFKMKLSTGIIVIVLLFTFMDVTNGTEYRMYDGHELGYGCHKGYCWTYCGASWVSFFLFYFSFIHQLTTIQYFKTSNI